MKWRHLRQEGFLTLAIVLGAGFVIALILPELDWRGAVVLIAIVALVLGWNL